jgi:beta-glucosidase
MNSAYQFPKGFYWGTATSAYQIEGAWDRDGKGESIWDRFSHTPGRIDGGDTGDVACDHYHRWREDLDLLKELGTNAYRFSVSWPRVLPEGRGGINQKGLDYYRRLVDGLRERGIEPFVTLYHWDLPQALHEAGGWLNRQAAEWFADYAQVVYEALGDRVRYWTTINEPNVCARLGYLSGAHAPGIADRSAFLRACHHLLLAHGAAVRRGRTVLRKAEFGIVPAIGASYPATDRPEDREAAEIAWTESWRYLDPLFRAAYPERLMPEIEAVPGEPIVRDGDLDQIAAPLDFLGVNHYSSHFHHAGPNGEPLETERPDLPKNSLGWNVYPDGFRDMLLKVTGRYGKLPIFIMENGAAYPDRVAADGQIHDGERVEYYRQYLGALQEAIAAGVDVRGYFAWSLMDNFEWARGYDARFGLVYVDFETQQRTVKDSGKFYSRVIRENGLFWKE